MRLVYPFGRRLTRFSWVKPNSLCAKLVVSHYPHHRPLSTSHPQYRRGRISSNPFIQMQQKNETRLQYHEWSKDLLVGRLLELEAQNHHLRSQVNGHQLDVAHNNVQIASTSDSTTTPVKKGKAKKVKPDKKEKKPKVFDLSAHPCRKIALRFSYEGSGYSGLAAQNGPAAGNPLPTVEALLWEALCTTRLVDPALGMEATGWSRCGRTDRGVSAAGQVVAFWVRSRKVDQWHLRTQEAASLGPIVADKGTSDDAATDATPSLSGDAEEQQQIATETQPTRKLEDEELPYVQMLNRILPPSIRVQAWSPVRPDFSARFDCTYRHYKYFFTAGAPPVLFPTSLDDGGADAASARLDIDAMRDAVSRLLGEHDFRNLCKVDASKQITNFRRRIDGVSIDIVSTGWPFQPSSLSPSASSSATSGAGLSDENLQQQTSQPEPIYVLNLRGTAFLYHQVRNIMAILFLIGARLEKPQIVDELMNVKTGTIAADRIKIRLAALQGVKSTTDPTEETKEIKWWLPMNPTGGGKNRDGIEDEREMIKQAKDVSQPMWIPKALESDPFSFLEYDDQLEMYETKPNYEMASDRPLVLWECGFLPSDIGWRAGTYDGPLPIVSSSSSSSSDKEQEQQQQQQPRYNDYRIAADTIHDLHTQWTQQSIKTELLRHFLLATASPHTGTIATRSTFQQAAFPFLPLSPSSSSPSLSSLSHNKPTTSSSSKYSVVPLGYGTHRGSTRYHPLVKRFREDSFVEKNKKWMETTGKRRAEKHELQQQQQQQNEDTSLSVSCRLGTRDDVE